MADPVPWTFAAAGDISERLEWLTDLMMAPTGPEQRRRLRPAPRLVQVFDTLESAQARRQMENVLVANGAGTWLVPLKQDTTLLDAAWTLGDPTNILAVDTRYRRFTVGGSVLLIGSDSRVFDVGQVASLTATTLTLVAPPTHTWPDGTQLIPLALGRLDGAPSLSRFTGDAAPAQIAFKLTAPLDWPADAGAATYRTLPVLELQIDWSQDPTVAAERRLDTVDAETGPISVYDLPGIPLSLSTVQFSIAGRAAIADFRSLLFALAGRWSPLWIPTRAQDFLVTAPLVSASTLLDVEWCGFNGWAVLPNRRDIRIELTNGTILYRRIVSAAALGADQERLTLDSALGVNAAASEVRLVSFLTLARQDTDVNLLSFWTSELVLSQMAFRGFRDDVV